MRCVTSDPQHMDKEVEYVALVYEMYIMEGKCNTLFVNLECFAVRVMCLARWLTC